MKTSINLTWEQDWLPKLKSKVKLSFSNSDYDKTKEDTKGGGAFKKRSDDKYKGKVTLNYDIQEWLKTKFEYQYKETNSNFDDKDQIRNQTTVTVTMLF